MSVTYDRSVTCRPTVTVSATPDYSTGDCIGGIITLSGVNPNRSSSELRSVTLKDLGNQGPALTLLFFRSTPSGGTYTDNAALDLHATNDAPNLVGVVSILSTDWKTVDSQKFLSVGDIGQGHGFADVDGYMLILADGSWNAGSTTDFTVELTYLPRA